jgi:ABC-type glutathione transport system ATPase component
VSLLAVDELRVRVATDDRPLQIVDGVSYAVDEGRIFGIAGESGSGKTVSVLALMGLLPRGASVTGTARFEGNDLVSMPSARLREVCGREIGLVFQDPLTSFHPMLSVGRQLTEHLRHHYGTSRTDARGRAVALLEEVRIPDPEWGSVVAVGTQYFQYWWMGTFPGLAIFSAVIAFNFLGDSLRDRLDPRGVSRSKHQGVA